MSVEPIDVERVLRRGQYTDIFRLPCFTEDLLAWARLIAPHLNLDMSELSRAKLELVQNGASLGEFLALRDLLEKVPKPRRILEIGAGMGRSVVFFSKVLHWQDIAFHLYDADGDSATYPMLGARSEESYYGNCRLLSRILDYNATSNYRLLNSRQTGGLRGLGRTYDFIYSFYSVGFHWKLEDFLDDILALMHERSIASFVVPGTWKPEAGSPLLALPHRLIHYRWPSKRCLGMFTLAKSRSAFPAS